jgi:hypothetical protein
MTQIHPKPTLLALLKAERQIEAEIRDRCELLVQVKAEIADRMAQDAHEPPRPVLH